MTRPANARCCRPTFRPGPWLAAAVLVAAGCAGNGPARPDTSSSAQSTLRPEPNPTPETAPPATDSGGPAVVIDGSTLPWGALRTALTEAAGVLVLEEVVLDRALQREAARRGVTIGEAEVRAEESALLDELTAAGTGQNRMEVLAQIRRSRGLGPTRYDALLRRNATLRALVRDEARPDAAELELARRLAFGQTSRVRLFVSSSESEAARVRADVLAAGPESRAWVFAERAGASSTHPSGARGGLIDSFHPEDPAYPSILGNAVRDTPAGEVSPLLATAAGFAVVLVESVRPARSPGAGETEMVERRVRQRKERLAMERLARELIERTSVSPVDPDLARAWRERR